MYIANMGRIKLGKERINITLPAGMAEELLQAAQEEGRDRSDLITEWARTYLTKRAKAKADATASKKK